MEVVVVTNLGIENGFMRKKIHLVNPQKENVMGKTHGYFSKAEKKLAKQNYKHSVK